MHISVSEMISYWECPRRWRRSLDVKTPQSPAQERGEWVHAVVEAMLRGQAPPAPLAEAEEMWASKQIDLLTSNYERWYLPGLIPEVKLEMPICDIGRGESVTLRGRLDGLTLGDGRATILEIKTSSRAPDSRTPWRSPQALLYALLVRAAHPEIEEAKARYLLLGPRTLEVVDRPLENLAQWQTWAERAAEQMYYAQDTLPTFTHPTFSLHCSWCPHFADFCQPLEMFGRTPIEFKAAEDRDDSSGID